MGKVQKPLTTVSGKFQVGMTAAQAKAKKCYSSFWNRDFKNIDKNNDGVLSAKEICDERDRECKMDKRLVKFGRVNNSLIFAAGMTISEIGVGLPIMCSAAASISIGELKAKQITKEKQKTEQYRKKHPNEFKA